MAKYPASVAAYGKPGGGAWVAGDTIVLRNLGRTLRAIATNGPNAFYTGWIADSIAATMGRHGGLISKHDLAAYQAKMRTPLHGTYRGYDLITMPPPTSGGVTMLEMLNILERFDLAKLGNMSPAALHVEIEAMRRGYLDRARYLGDPDFVKMPIARLTSKTIRRTRRAAWNSGTTSWRKSRPRRTTRRRSFRSSTARATPCRTRSRSRAGSGRTWSSTAPDSSSTTRWATSTRSRERRTSLATSGQRRISSPQASACSAR
jgi:gamma-glutamyltranspeptidase